jgi:hypothetical protein
VTYFMVRSHPFSIVPEDNLLESQPIWLKLWDSNPEFSKCGADVLTTTVRCSFVFNGECGIQTAETCFLQVFAASIKKKSESSKELFCVQFY